MQQFLSKAVIILFIFASYSAVAQVTGKITGVVIDSATNKPVEFASVALLKEGTTQSLTGSITDNSGKFSLAAGEGAYEIVVSFIGYETRTIKEITITAASPEVALNSIHLAPASTNLDEITVQAMRPTIRLEADKMVMSIEGTALAAGNTAFDILGKTPGVFIDHEGNIQLNGKSGVMVMLNGKRTYLSANDLKTLLDGMPAENIKDIEIITNPSAKYDAEGTSGILNINLKKNLQQGLNGSIYASWFYNKMHGYSSGLNLFYKSGKWNTFLTTDKSSRVGGREATFTRVFHGSTGTTYFDQVATSDWYNYGPPSLRAGVDYNFNDNHSIGVIGSIFKNTLHSNFLTETYIGPSPTEPALFIDADNYNTNVLTNLTGNLHYQGKLDTSGTTLSMDLDYVKIRNNSKAIFYNLFDSLNITNGTISDILFTRIPSGFDIYSAKADLTYRFSPATKFETGVKGSHVNSDNDSKFYFNNTGLVLDTQRTNHFIYAENIYAAYVNLNTKLSDKFTLQAGLRLEHTDSEGESVTLDQVTPRAYTDLFPTVFVGQKVSDNYQISYSYGRRIDRPYYGNLNPFIFYRDPYTYIQGNPYLRPQYTHAFSVTQTIKETYNFVLKYEIVKDFISELPRLDVENATTIYFTGNVDDAYTLGLTALIPIKISKRWESSNTIILLYDDYSINIDNLNLENKHFFYMFQSVQNIQLPKNFKLELNGAYRGPGAYGLYLIKPMWWINVGLKKRFFDDKLDVSVSANDIFKGRRLRFTTDIGENINEFDQYFRNRSVVVSLRYNFSRGAKFNAQQRKNNLEELKRTGN